MSQLIFPASPSNGDTFDAPNGVTYTYQSPPGVWTASGGGGGGGGTVTSITAGDGLTGGTITTSGTIALASTTVTAGSYTSADITVDAQGRITAASDGGGGGGVIPSGTTMSFFQSTAPVGFTQVTTYNNVAIRVVDGVGGGSGGTKGFTTVFSSASSYDGTLSITSGATAGSSLSTAQLASHTHSYTAPNQKTANGPSVNAAAAGQSNLTTGSAGSNGAHTHSLVGVTAGGTFTSNFDLQYIDMILCTKD